MKNLNIISIIASISIAYSCTNIPETGTNNSTKIMVGYGPEDIVLDTVSTQKRIITGCLSRRANETQKPNIYYYNIEGGETGILERTGEPSDFKLYPHGMDLIVIDSVQYLYVINHRDDILKQQVVKYEVLENELVFNQLYENRLYVSPNDICVYKDGSFWITNDAGKRGSMIEKILKLKKSTIIYTNLNSECSIVADNLAYANGITYKNQFLYVSTTMQNKLFRFNIESGKLTNKKLICDIKGGDNITRAGNDLIIASHQNFFAYMKHAKNNLKKSIFAINNLFT
ncbi:MAG: SMP-30/gluconolactonase/LRE family protein, partial [Chlorobi bacterium]|nr:SMP-30/gluconolactonase/LRE family protein [Chlorobiota bacterium]